MSFRVVGKILRESEEKLARRLILIVIGEAASDDGVAFVGQETIAKKARLSHNYVITNLADMVREGVLEVRKAQRGRRRINVYRVILPGLDDPPEYERLPFTLTKPFSPLPTTSDIRRSSNDDVGTFEPTTSELSSKPAASPLVEPSLEPSLPPAGGTEAQDLVPTTGANVVVGEFVDLLRELGHDPAERVKGQLAKMAKQLLDEGASLDDVRAGVRRMVERRTIRPDLLANFVAEAAIGAGGRDRERVTPTGAQTATSLLEEAAQLAREGR